MMEHKWKMSEEINNIVHCEMTGDKFVIHFWVKVPVGRGKEQLWQARAAQRF